MDIKLTCPGCGQHILTDSSAGGQTIHCPSCTAPLIVPEIAAPPPPRAPLPVAKKGMSTGLILLFVFLGLGLLGLVSFVAIPAFVIGRAEAKKNFAAYEARQAALSNAASLMPAALTNYPPPQQKTGIVRSTLTAAEISTHLKAVDRRYFTVKTDEITLSTTIRSRYNEEYRRETCYLVLALQPERKPTLFLVAHYGNSEEDGYFHFNTVMFRAGDKLHTLKDNDLDNTVTFTLNSAEDYVAVQSLIASPPGVTVRFDGPLKFRDVKLTANELLAMKQVMWLWGQMQ